MGLRDHWKLTNNRQIETLLNEGITVSSKSAFTGPLLLTSTPKKPDASGKVKWRVVVIDFRKLNERRVGDAYPIPNITDTSDQLGKARISLLSS